MMLGYIGSNFAGAFLLAWIYFSRSTAIDEYNCSQDVLYWKKLIVRASFPATYSFAPSDNLLNTIGAGINDIENLYRDQMKSLRAMLGNKNSYRRHGDFIVDTLISQEELSCLPEIEKEYQILVTKMNEIKKEIADLEDLDTLGIRESGDRAEKEEKIQELRHDAEDLIKKLSSIQQKKLQHINPLKQREEHIRHWMLEGYESLPIINPGKNGHESVN
jgi:hypothetical protein